MFKRNLEVRLRRGLEYVKLAIILGGLFFISACAGVQKTEKIMGPVLNQSQELTAEGKSAIVVEGKTSDFSVYIMDGDVRLLTSVGKVRDLIKQIKNTQPSSAQLKTVVVPGNYLVCLAKDFPQYSEVGKSLRFMRSGWLRTTMISRTPDGYIGQIPYVVDGWMIHDLTGMLEEGITTEDFLSGLGSERYGTDDFPLPFFVRQGAHFILAEVDKNARTMTAYIIFGRELSVGQEWHCRISFP